MITLRRWLIFRAVVCHFYGIGLGIRNRLEQPYTKDDEISPMFAVTIHNA